jgi:hypothetical protein
MATWRELEAEGVKRCCCTFTNGKRCRRRASAQFDASWCDKHGPIMKAHTDFALKAMKEQQAIDDEIDA